MITVYPAVYSHVGSCEGRRISSVASDRRRHVTNGIAIRGELHGC